MSLAALALAAAGGGALYAIGYVAPGGWPVSGVFLAPLWWALERARDRAVAVAAMLGFTFGFVAHTAGFAWLLRLVDVFLAGDRALGAALWLAHGIVFAAGFAAYAALFRALRACGRGVALAGIAPLVAVEWLAPQIFPVHAGSPLVAVPLVAQSADLGGPLVLTAIVAATNAGVFAVVDRACKRTVASPRGLALAAAIALVVVAYGAVRLREYARDPGASGERVLRVGIVQANLDVTEKREVGLASQREHQALSRGLLAEAPLDLVVWPETAIARALRRPLPLDGSLVRGDLDVPLLFGGTSVFEEGGRRTRTNSAFLVGADGMIRSAYDKNLLIPVAEWLPLETLLPALRERFPHAQRFRAASDTPALALGDARIATPICYEAVRPEFVRAMQRATSPHLIVTLANDAWFGDSREPYLHLDLARLRAIEQRRWLVRATNSGISAVVDPAGRVRASTGVLERATLRGEVELLEGSSLFARAGSWPGPLACAVIAIALVRPSHAREGARDDGEAG